MGFWGLHKNLPKKSLMGQSAGCFNFFMAVQEESGRGQGIVGLIGLIQRMTRKTS